MKIIHKNKRIKFLSKNNNVNIQKTNTVTNSAYVGMERVDVSRISYIAKIRTTLPPDIILSDDKLILKEGDEIKFFISLSSFIGDKIIVDINLNNDYCTLDKTELIFTEDNYSIPQQVMLTGIHDENINIIRTSIITVNSNDCSNSCSISVTLVDIDNREGL